MGIRPGSRARLVDAPAVAVEAMVLPELSYVDEADEADHVHLFVVIAADLRTAFLVLAAGLATGGALWVSWPKGRRLGSDLTLPRVIEIGYDAGLVESTCLRVDDVWAGLKFTHPKPGKVYANSYGTLPAQRD